MKYLILSDIHGSLSCLEPMIDLFNEQSFDYILLLGDILYHGPRNPLPDGHNPAAIATLLNKYSSKIIACRGNCDAEVDQMLLNFPCLSDYTLTFDEGIKIFSTHGHIYTSENFPRTSEKQIFLYGHTHLWEIREDDNVVICNPGSISLPKQNRPKTYGTYENGVISVFDFDHTLLSSLKLN